MNPFKNYLINIGIPRYLKHWQHATTFTLVLCLVIMLCTEPILHCIGSDRPWLTERCEASARHLGTYSFFSSISMSLYYLLLMDLGVFMNRFSAYMLVCEKVSIEVMLFLLMVLCALIAFSTSFSCLEQPLPQFNGFTHGSLALWEMVLGLFDQQSYDKIHTVPVILLGVYAFMIIVGIFLVNMLIAQLCCAYDEVFNDMVGYARLNRLSVTVDSMPFVTKRQWTKFVRGLHFEKKLEFEKDDIGLGNGIACVECAAANPTTHDKIQRYGGTTSVSMRWPESESSITCMTDKWERLEQQLKKAMERLTKAESQVDSTRLLSAGGDSSTSGSSDGNSSGRYG